MSANDFTELKRAADVLWPGAILTNSSVILGLAKLKASDVLNPRRCAEEVQASELRHHRAERKRHQTPPSRGRYLKSLPRLKEALPNYSADRERAIRPIP
jgi:hypothetical protein